ncbi:hypothetical protein MHUMG1_08921 [Metarhizium humberi]|uniref:FAD-binding domain-containing protein n=1 Tax=Metarhizium humberi TaxID=2596975 RepID=A0A9P8M5H9_9HYPO|nr:hypothetical protein MHUMG1_08921 [Metarhizium humberi]
MSKDEFKVIIVGGSVAGLVLAHCLQHLGIEYVVLEKRHEISPQEGASIGIMPNGGRILDQLGLYDQIEKLIEPLNSAHVLYPDGFNFDSRYPILLTERFGFPLAFLDRQKLLEILHTSLPEDGKIHTNKRVVRIHHHDDRVIVEASDKSRYVGEIVVGADGVHSKVRAEMWRLAGSLDPGRIKEDEKGITVEYACVFGISSSHPGLTPGQQISCFNNGRSILSVVGKCGRTFWFLFLKLDKRYAYGAAPRFSEKEAAFHCEKLRSEPFWGSVRFGDLWDRREVFNMTPLEEALFTQWHLGRMVCIGDSMHKFAPHIGQGANCAMEDAACLSNRLHEYFATSGSSKPSSSEVVQIFQELAQQRIHRLTPMDRTARFAMRLQAREGMVKRLLGRLFVPYAGDKLADWASADIADTVTLDFLPASKRGGPGWQKFRPRTRTRTRRCMSGLVAGILFICGESMSKGQDGRACVKSPTVKVTSMAEATFAGNDQPVPQLQTRHLDEYRACIFTKIPFITLLLCKGFYNLYLHPLRNFRGPRIAASSFLYYLYWVFSGKLHAHIKDLHDEYGDVVRISPNMLVYRNVQVWKDVYGHRKHGAPAFMKDPEFYPDTPTGHTIVTTPREEDHSRMRQCISHAFSEKALREQGPLLQRYVDLLIDRLHRVASSSTSTATDMTEWYNYTTFDIIGDLAFGEPFDCLQNSHYHQWVKAVFATMKAGALFKPILSLGLPKSLVTFFMPPELKKRAQENYAYTQEKAQRRVNMKTTRPDFMTYILRHRMENNGKGMTLNEIQANATIFIIAGSETSATVLSGCTFYLLSHPAVYKALVKEIRDGFTKESNITLPLIAKLPYLNAVLEETLRMYPPVPAILPRKVPCNGAVINGQFVPGGTSVTMAWFSAFRSQSHFADAESFIPERWLSDSRDPRFKDDLREIHQPFSYGPRNCLGKNLAYAEMRLILVRLLWNFDMSLDGECEHWADQKAYSIWEKKPLMVKLVRAQR